MQIILNDRDIVEKSRKIGAAVAEIICNEYTTPDGEPNYGEIEMRLIDIVENELRKLEDK